MALFSTGDGGYINSNFITHLTRQSRKKFKNFFGIAAGKPFQAHKDTLSDCVSHLVPSNGWELVETCRDDQGRLVKVVSPVLCFGLNLFGQLILFSSTDTGPIPFDQDISLRSVPSGKIYWRNREYLNWQSWEADQETCEQ
jgi:hypothetical protein